MPLLSDDVQFRSGTKIEFTWAFPNHVLYVALLGACVCLSINEDGSSAKSNESPYVYDITVKYFCSPRVH